MLASPAKPSATRRAYTSRIRSPSASPSVAASATVDAGHGPQVAAGAGQHLRRVTRGGGGAGERPQGATRRDGLPVSPLAARALRPGRVERPVADLGGEAVRAPEDPTVADDPAADAGPERDDQPVRDAAGGAVTQLTPRGGVGVVVDNDGQAEALDQRGAGAGRG